jgi:hypothetical protein
MEHPYKKYEGSLLWEQIKKSLHELEVNKDIAVKTSQYYIIGYLCQQLSESELIDLKS